MTRTSMRPLVGWLPSSSKIGLSEVFWAVWDACLASVVVAGCFTSAASTRRQQSGKNKKPTAADRQIRYLTTGDASLTLVLSTRGISRKFSAFMAFGSIGFDSAGRRQLTIITILAGQTIVLRLSRHSTIRCSELR